MTEEHRINIMEDPLMPGENAQETPQAPEIAGVLERFVALLIDTGIILVLYQILMAVLLRYIQPDLEQLYWLAAGIIIPFILYMACFSCGGRNTLGKALVGIRVVSWQKGEPLGFIRAGVRAVAYVFSAGLLLCGFLWAFIDDKHRTFHDYLAGSVVIQSRPKGFFEKTALTLTGLILLIAFSGYFYKQLFGAGSLAQQRLISKAQEHVEKIAYLEDLHRLHFGYYTNDLLRLSILSGDPVQFQRDTHKVLDRKGFRIGVSQAGYKIKAHAKDTKKTAVYYPNF